MDLRCRTFVLCDLTETGWAISRFKSDTAIGDPESNIWLAAGRVSKATHTAYLVLGEGATVATRVRSGVYIARLTVGIPTNVTLRMQTGSGVERRDLGEFEPMRK